MLTDTDLLKTLVKKAEHKVGQLANLEMGFQCTEQLYMLRGQKAAD